MEPTPKDCLLVVIPITPVPASRPRVTKWGVYYGKNYTKFMNEFPTVCPEPPQKLLCLVYVTAEFVCKRPKKVTRETPVGDIDNLAKGLFDGMTKMGYWKDDDQIAYTTLNKRYAEVGEEPHIEVEIFEYEG